MSELRLIALDEDDLAVISAHLQDAVLRIADMTFLPREKRFAFVANRFDWEGAAEGARRKSFERRRTGVHFERVSRVRTKNIRLGAKDAVVELLAVTFAVADAPAGQISLVFAGGGVVELEVECIEAQMSDLGGAWGTQVKPQHALDDGKD